MGLFDGVWKLRLHRWTSPSSWTVRLLGLSEFPDSPETPGLVMVQIDGLAHEHLSRALQKGHMPFLRRLYEKEHYTLYPLYSGVPSNTPSVQGEIFYGVKQAVPAFCFKDSSSGKIFKMYRQEAAGEVERRLKKQGKSLLEGGSSYGNIFSGGADESYYTAATFGWDSLRHLFKPATVPLMLILNFHIVLRAVFLTLFELWLALFDFARGIRKGYNVLSELRFILTRVIVIILLRELITAQVRMDITRGRPVIHLNFFGYDEQAHRRGPSSWFAYWSLRGIDSAIRRIAEEAQLSLKRHYEVWVYSDHGQGDYTPYPHRYGCKVEDAITRVYTALLGPVAVNIEDNRFFFRGGPVCSGTEGTRTDGKSREEGRKRGTEESLFVSAVGPLGLIYPPKKLMERELESFAKALVLKAHIPGVMAFCGYELCVWTAKGKMGFREGLTELLGNKHPYFEEVCRDLETLMSHPDAAPLIFFGGALRREPPVTFPDEHGSHGGISPAETNAFALLPADVPLTCAKKKYILPRDIRTAAMRFLDRLEEVVV